MKESIKELIKHIMGLVLYVLYKYKILKNKLQVASIDETIDVLINSEKSLIRFGDRELELMINRDSFDQKGDKVLSARLNGIIKFEDENLLIGIPDIFDDLSQYRKKSAIFWMKNLLKFRKIYYQLCDTSKLYYNAFVTRPYYLYEDKSHVGRQFAKICDIWLDKNIVVVEGEIAHNGVDNDLFAKAKSIKRIMAPAQNAYQSYDKILEECKKCSKDDVMLLAIGATSKILAQDLFEEGYRVIDIGNLDMEYEWYLSGSTEKYQVPKQRAIGVKANIEAGYREYLDQIICWIE